MSKLPGGNFDASKVDPNAGFEPIPAGEYVVMITDSAMMPTRAQDGEYLKLTFKVLEGPYAGRLIWSNLNLVNKNEKAVEIANKELSGICHAVDVMNPEDSQELHGIPMRGKVKIKPAQGGYDPSNTISFFQKYDGAPLDPGVNVMDGQPNPF